MLISKYVNWGKKSKLIPNMCIFIRVEFVKLFASLDKLDV